MRTSQVIAVNGVLLLVLAGCVMTTPSDLVPMVDPDQRAADSGLPILVIEHPCGGDTTIGCYNVEYQRIELHPGLTTKSTRDAMILTAIALHNQAKSGEAFDPCAADEQAIEWGAKHSVYLCPGLPQWEPSMDSY